jgi:Flp pilus assembly secretin CpaC
MPTFQGAPRSLLPPPEPPEVTSFTPDAGRRQEASADPEMVTVAPRAPSSVQPGPVAIPVNESADPEMAPARAIGAPAEVRTVPRSREHKVLPVIMDQAMVVRAPRDVRTMILGNPMIADVASQKGGLIVITGKMYGSTNLLLADAKGRVIGEAMIQVRPPTVDVVTVQLGLQRQSYSCTPQCQPTQVVGNEQSWFASTSGQAQQRSQGMKQ